MSKPSQDLTLSRGGLVEGILCHIHGDVGQLLQDPDLEVAHLVVPRPLLPIPVVTQ